MAKVALSLDETLIATGSRSGQLCLWELTTSTKKWSVAAHTKSIEGVAFSPDGRVIATAGFDGTLKAFEAVNGNERFSVGPFTKWIRKVVFSPDGQWIVTSLHFGEEPGILVNASTGEIAARFPGDEHLLPVFSPDGSVIATGYMDGSNTAR